MPLQKLVALAVLFGFGAVGLSAAILRVIKVKAWNQWMIWPCAYICIIVVFHSTHFQVHCRLSEQSLQGKKRWIQIIE